MYAQPVPQPVFAGEYVCLDAGTGRGTVNSAKRQYAHSTGRNGECSCEVFGLQHDCKFELGRQWLDSEHLRLEIRVPSRSSSFSVKCHLGSSHDRHDRAVDGHLWYYDQWLGSYRLGKVAQGQGVIGDDNRGAQYAIGVDVATVNGIGNKVSRTNTGGVPR